MPDHIKDYSDWLETKDSSQRQVIVNYDITYPEFTKLLLAYLDKQFSFDKITESTYLLVKRLRREEIKSLIIAIKTKYEFFKDQINEGARQLKSVRVVLIIPDGINFHMELVLDEII